MNADATVGPMVYDDTMIRFAVTSRNVDVKRLESVLRLQSEVADQFSVALAGLKAGPATTASEAEEA